MMKKTRENGAIVIEASISLTAFMFALFMIISIVDIAYVQYKVAVALDSAAKEISQYSYLYYKFNMDDFSASLAENAADSKKTVDNTIEGMGDVMDAFSDAGDSFETADFDSAINSIKGGATAASETLNNLADEIAKDPKAFLVGMGNLAASELTEEVKNVLGQVLAKAFMQKNLKTVPDEDADSFLRSHKVVDGMDGLNFEYTTLMAYGTSNEINLVTTYEVAIVKLLNVDFKFKFRQMAKTVAWGEGISLINPASIWETMPPMARGSYIVAQERANYGYQSSSNGFDAYNNSGGRNEFVSITSIDPTSGTYANAAGIQSRLNKEFNSMYNGVTKLGDPITVTTTDGNSTQVASNPSTRTYRMVIVLPEGTDSSYLTEVNTAITNFKQAHPDYTIEVDIKQAYGSLPEPEAEGGDSEES